MGCRMPLVLPVGPRVSYLPLGAAISSSCHGKVSAAGQGLTPRVTCPALGLTQDKSESGSNVHHLPKQRGVSLESKVTRVASSEVSSVMILLHEIPQTVPFWVISAMVFSPL